MSSKVYYFAVRQYKDIYGAPEGIPLDYPEKVIPLGTSQTLPAGTWTLMTDKQLADLKKDLKSAWQAYQQRVYVEKMMTNGVKAAMEFGKQLMAEYGAKNLFSGKTSEEVKLISQRMASIQSLLLSGALPTALEEIDNLEPDSLISQAVIDEFKAKITKFLTGN